MYTDYVLYYLSHASGPKIENWGKVGSDQFKKAKHDYNIGYYQRNKVMWTPKYKQSKSTSTPFDGALGDVIGNVSSAIAKKETTDKFNNMVPGLGDAINSTANYFEKNKDQVGSIYVDTLETGLNASVNIGKAVIKELKERHDENWDSGWHSIKKAVTDTKKNFNDTWASGMTSIVNGIKNFASLWKSGW